MLPGNLKPFKFILRFLPDDVFVLNVTPQSRILNCLQEFFQLGAFALGYQFHPSIIQNIKLKLKTY